MKKFTKSLLFVACLSVTLLTFGAIISNAQTLSAKNSNKNILAQIVREKSQNKPFALISPDDSAKIPAEEMRMAGGGNPCDTAVAISIGQTIGNALNGTDCRLEDNSYADFYTFQGTQGQQITLHLGAGSFDPYLGLANLSGTFVVEDDDGGGGWNSQIAVTLPETGTYVILVNSVLPNQFGGYTLKTSGAAPCTFSLSPTSTEVPAAGGTFTFNVNTQAGCHWQAFSQNNFTTTNSAGIGSGTVTYTVSQNGSGSTRTGSVIVSTSPLITTYNSFSITQTSVSCNYSLTPASVNVAATASSGSFQVTAPAGCPWSIDSNGPYVTASGSGTGNGTVNYSIMHNNGAARVQIIVVAGQTFTINQAGLDCTFQFSPNPINIGRQGGTRTINIDTQPGCVWSATRSQLWVELQSASGAGAGTITVQIQPQTEAQARSGAVQFWYGTSSTAVWIDQSRNFTSPVFDFDADGKTDIGIFRPSLGEWWYLKSSNGQNYAAQFGASTDKIVPGDFTGDGKTDIALFRSSTGEWFVLRSEDGSYYSFPFGTSGDIPVPADYDNDGKADAAVYRPSTSTWYVSKSSGGVTIRDFGLPGDVPVVADYDSDGKADIAIYRPSLGEWWIQRSRDGLIAYQFGNSADKPVQGDYTGDGYADVALFRPSTGEWFVLRSENRSYYSFAFGTNGDIPAAGDYDGDGRFDAAVFRSSDTNWYIQRTTAGTLIQNFGQNGDLPVPNAFTP